MNNEKIPLSVAIITKNEAKMLPDCLKSISFVDDIVVIDSGSTDNTVKIAKEKGCRVYIEDWKGYGPQKQSAVNKCKNDFVLILDADERIHNDSGEALKVIIKDSKESAYSFKRKTYIGSKWIKHCGWWPDWVIRLIDRNKCRIEGTIHERINVDGSIVKLDDIIDHYLSFDYSQMIEKLNNYSTYTSNELYKNNSKVNYLTPVVHGISMFFKTFFIKRGFMDGMDGLVISVLSANNSFFKYAKLYQKKRTDSE